MYKDILFTISIKYCKNKQEAEDNLHDSFIEIFKNIKKYNGKGSFEGWIKRITTYKAIDRYKKQMNIFSEYDTINNLNTSVEINEEHISFDELFSFIQELPDKYRLVFNLYQLDNFSHKEISKILNISEGTSKSNLHRAKVILRQKLNTLLKHKTP